MDYELEKILIKISHERKKFLEDLVDSASGELAVQALREMRRNGIKLSKIPENLLLRGQTNAVIEALKMVAFSGLSLRRELFERLSDRSDKIKAEIILLSKDLCPWLNVEELRSYLHDYSSPLLRSAALFRLKDEMGEDEIIGFLDDPNLSVVETASIILSERFEKAEDFERILKIPLRKSVTERIVRRFLKKGGRIEDLLRGNYPKNVRKVGIKFLRNWNCDLLFNEFMKSEYEEDEKASLIDLIGLKGCSLSDKMMGNLIHILNEGKNGLKPAVIRFFRRTELRNKILDDILVKLMETTEDTRTLSEIVRYFSKWKIDVPSGVIKKIPELLNHPNKRVRKAVLFLIRRVKLRDFCEDVVKLLRNRMEPLDVRKNALKSLRIDEDIFLRISREILTSHSYPLDLKKLAVKITMKDFPEHLAEMVI